MVLVHEQDLIINSQVICWIFIDFSADTSETFGRDLIGLVQEERETILQHVDKSEGEQISMLK